MIKINTNIYRAYAIGDKRVELEIVIDKYLKESDPCQPEWLKIEGFFECLKNENKYEYTIKPHSKNYTILKDAFLKYVPSSYASKSMTSILDWRNLNALDDDTRMESVLFGCKLVISEIALPLIAGLAILETLIYGAMTIKDFALGKKYEWIDLLKSSAFTLFWTPSVFFYYNFFTKSPSDELFINDIKRLTYFIRDKL